MTKRQLIEKLEQLDCPDDTPVIACCLDGDYVNKVTASEGMEFGSTETIGVVVLA